MKFSNSQKYLLHIRFKLMPSVLISLISGCASVNYLSDTSTNIQYPEYWQTVGEEQTVSIENTSKLNTKKVSNHALEPHFVVSDLNNDKLQSFIELALKENAVLQTKKLAVSIAEQKAKAEGASHYPELTLGLLQSRRELSGSTVANSQRHQSNAELSLQLKYEVDLWGKLSEQRSRALLNYTSEKISFEYEKSLLIANVSKAWYDLIEANQLLNLYIKRSYNLAENLTTIQSSYELGLNDALDVYLTQNSVSSEQARVAQQQQIVSAQQRKLELLLGQYPAGIITGDEVLPPVEHYNSTIIPSQLMTKRPDLLGAWYQLLAANAELAIAHKQRFPSLSLSASLEDNADKITDVFSADNLLWSFVGNLTTPIFNAGKLASLEEQTKLALRQKEQQYLHNVYQAFSEVENGFSNQKQLFIQFKHVEAAADNAVTAETLSFEQYLKGLISYTTVLESQRRAFDAQSNLIKLTNQIIQNQISLYLAVGGFSHVEVGAINNSNNSQKPISSTQSSDELSPQISPELSNTLPLTAALKSD